MIALTLPALDLALAALRRPAKGQVVLLETVGINYCAALDLLSGLAGVINEVHLEVSCRLVRVEMDSGKLLVGIVLHLI